MDEMKCLPLLDQQIESAEADWLQGRLRHVPRGRVVVEELPGHSQDVPNRFIETLSRLARSHLYDYIFVELLGDETPLHFAQMLTQSSGRGTPLTELLQVLSLFLPFFISFYFLSLLSMKADWSVALYSLVGRHCLCGGRQSLDR